LGHRSDIAVRTSLPDNIDEPGLVGTGRKFVGYLAFGTVVFGAKLLLDLLVVDLDN
jgi:hypothetical protein